MDPKILADVLTTFLAPAMPYLITGGGELVKEAGETLAEKAPEWIKRLWTRLRPKVEEKPAAAEAVQLIVHAGSLARAMMRHRWGHRLAGVREGVDLAKTAGFPVEILTSAE